MTLHDSILDLVDGRLDERNLFFQLKELHHIRCALDTAEKTFGKSDRIEDATYQVGHCRRTFFCCRRGSFNRSRPQRKDLPQEALHQFLDLLDAEAVPREVNNVIDGGYFLPDEVLPANFRRDLLSAFDTNRTAASVAIVIRDFVHHELPAVLHLSSFFHQHFFFGDHMQHLVVIQVAVFIQIPLGGRQIFLNFKIAERKFNVCCAVHVFQFSNHGVPGHLIALFHSCVHDFHHHRRHRCSVHAVRVHENGKFVGLDVAVAVLVHAFDWREHFLDGYVALDANESGGVGG